MLSQEQITNLLDKLNKTYETITQLRKDRGVSYTFENKYFYISGRSLCEKNKSNFVRGLIKKAFLKKDLESLLNSHIESANRLLEIEEDKKNN